MDQLTGKDRKMLREAIQRVYLSYDELRLFVGEELNVPLNQIVSEGKSLDQTVFKLIDWAVAKGRLHELLVCLRDDNQQNAVMRQKFEHLLQNLRGVRKKRRDVLLDLLKWCGLSALSSVSIVGLAKLTKDELLPVPTPTPTPVPTLTPTPVPTLTPTPVPTLTPTPVPTPTDKFRTFGAKTISIDTSGKRSEKRIKVQYFTEWVGQVGLDMVSIAGGEFVRGSSRGEHGRTSNEEPLFRVIVPSFWMGRYAITQEQWEAVAKLPKVNRDFNIDPSGFKGTRRPVERVIWDEAKEFCSRLSQVAGTTYRLPSEAEWEYACRAGMKTPFTFGASLAKDIANYYPTKKTVEVGSFPPNSWGLYDMHGNVWEWCEDAWKNSYDGVPTDGGPHFDNGTRHKVIRGGTWNVLAIHCRSAFRGDVPRDYRRNNIGFRVVCDTTKKS